MMIRFLTTSRLAASSLVILFGLTACSTMPGQQPTVKTSSKDGPPPFPVDVSQLKDAVPRYEPKSHYGNNDYAALGKHYYVMDSAKGYDQIGMASWYGSKFHGRLTSNHETYDMLAMTAASPSLPLPTYVRVTNLENGKQVIVKVNDRGPFASSRIMDLSYAAAKKLGYAEKGTARVRVQAIEVLAQKEPRANAHASSAPKQLYLQVGSFRQMAKAEQVKAKVTQLTHHTARIETVTTNDKPLYRVQVGPLRETQKSNIATQLQHQGFTNAVPVLG